MCIAVWEDSYLVYYLCCDQQDVGIEHIHHLWLSRRAHPAACRLCRAVEDVSSISYYRVVVGVACYARVYPASAVMSHRVAVGIKKLVEDIVHYYRVIVQQKVEIPSLA